jgi:hypothetical protein
MGNRRCGYERQIQGRQAAVIEDLFNGEISISPEEILFTHGVTRLELSEWLQDKRFNREIRRRIRWAYRCSEILVAKCAMVAAAKLVGLTDSEIPETSRKACLDIISLLRIQTQRKKVSSRVTSVSPVDSPEPSKRLDPETADLLLKTLADAKRAKADRQAEQKPNQAS